MLFSIGPVQEFIAQARRTRDLWFGSYLLSELSKAAAMKFADCKGELIYPYISNELIQLKCDDQRLKSLKVPNKVLGIVKTNDPNRVAWEVRQAITGSWKEYADKAAGHMQRYINSNAWERQVKDLVEFYAVWSQIEDGDSYQEKLERLENLLNARKTLKDFKQNDPGKLYGEKKSSLDSGRESVLYLDQYENYQRFGIKKNEALDAISIVKRMSHHITELETNFPSVCETAFKPFINVLEKNTEAKKYVDSYYDELKQNHGEKVNFPGYHLHTYDSRLFYESRIEEYIEENAIGISDEKKLSINDSISLKLTQLYSNLKKLNIEFSPYYAFLLCDGDRMGELQRKMATVEQHKKFSEQLSRFADQAEEIVKRRQGSLIYSGGDDVMAYVPLHQCLEVSEDLRTRFSDIVKEAVPDGQASPTLSVGIAIVHMREPLEEVRTLARKAEQMAKIRKNELAIIYQKRGGGDLMNISLPFTLNPVQAILELQKLYCKKMYSAQFAYALRSLYEQYRNMVKGSHWQVQGTALDQLLWQEVERLAWKKKPDHINKEQVETILLQRLKEMFKVEEEPLEKLRLLAEQVIIAITLAKAGNYTDELIANTTS